MRKLLTITAAAVAMAIPGLAAASTIPSTDSFFELYDFLDTAATGGLGTGIALAGLLIGAGIGAAKASAMPAVGGVATAAMFGFGPGLILDLVASGAMIAPVVG